MRRWNRILAALLAALMLCGAYAAVAEMELEPGTPLSAGEIELAPDPQTDGDALPDGVPALDGDLRMAHLKEDLVSSNAFGDEDEEADEGDDGEEVDDDFEIDDDGVLVEYNGPGGDVVIPDGVTGIDKEVFYECRSLTGIEIPASVTSIGDYAFKWCVNLASVTIPAGVKAIGDEAFWGCDSLTAVSIPASVTSIGDSAFGSCAHLKRISVSSKNPSYASRDGMLLTRNMKTLLTCPAAKTGATIPAGVKTIADWAFAKCQLTEVTIPKNVSSIGEGAFWACSAMDGVTLSKGLASIGVGAFEDCASLKTITVPSSVTLIDGGAFCGCGSLAGVFILAKKIRIYDYYYDDDDDRHYTFGGCSDELVIHTVIGSDAASWARKNGFEVNDTLLLLNRDTTHKLNAGYAVRIMLENAKAKSYASGDRKVAAVSKDGLVTAKSAGTAKITVTLTNGKKRVLTVKVPDTAALSEDALTLSCVDSAKLTLTGAMDRRVTWSSSDANVVKITKSSSKSATIVGVRAGSATVKAKIEGGKTLKCKVKVVDPLTISKSSMNNGKLYLKFTNRSDKKIVSVKFVILQYNNRSDRLKRLYSYYYLNGELDAHSDDTYCYRVNNDTKSIRIKITEVTFSDKTKWKP